jgi:hypothetical protein
MRLMYENVGTRNDFSYDNDIVLFRIDGGRKQVCLAVDEKDNIKWKWQYFSKIVNEKQRK